MKIAVLLHGRVKYDARVIKTINSLSESADVWLFQIGGEASDASVLADKVQLKNVQKAQGFKAKLIQHSFFYNSYSNLYDAALASGLQFDLIWANDLPVLKPAIRLKKLLKTKLLYDSHEIYLETINQFFPRKDNGELIKPWHGLFINFMRRVGSSFELEAFKEVDYFVTVNDSILKYFQAKYPVKKGFVVMNCPELGQANQGEVQAFRNEYKWTTQDKVFIYQGVLNDGRCLKRLVDVFSELPTDYKLFMLGEGPLKPVLEQKVIKSGLGHRIRFHGWVKNAELLQYTKGADYGISLVSNLNLSKKMASPNKVFEYMHAGKPVLVSTSAESDRILDRYPIGVKTGINPEQIKAGIIALTKADYSSFSKACDAGAREYSWSRQFNIVKEEILK